MAIKTLLFAGAATFGLCTGALAQVQATGNVVGSQEAISAGNSQTAFQAQRVGGRGLNVGLQAQRTSQNNNATNVVVQSTRAIAIQAVGRR